MATVGRMRIDLRKLRLDANTVKAASLLAFRLSSSSGGGTVTALPESTTEVIAVDPESALFAQLITECPPPLATAGVVVSSVKLLDLQPCNVVDVDVGGGCGAADTTTMEELARLLSEPIDLDKDFFHVEEKAAAPAAVTPATTVVLAEPVSSGGSGGGGVPQQQFSPFDLANYMFSALFSMHEVGADAPKVLPSVCFAPSLTNEQLRIELARAAEPWVKRIATHITRAEPYTHQGNALVMSLYEDSKRYGRAQFVSDACSLCQERNADLRAVPHHCCHYYAAPYVEQQTSNLGLAALEHFALPPRQNRNWHIQLCLQCLMRTVNESFVAHGMALARHTRLAPNNALEQQPVLEIRHPITRARLCPYCIAPFIPPAPSKPFDRPLTPGEVFYGLGFAGQVWARNAGVVSHDECSVVECRPRDYQFVVDANSAEGVVVVPSTNKAHHSSRRKDTASTPAKRRVSRGGFPTSKQRAKKPLARTATTTTTSDDMQEVARIFTDVPLPDEDVMAAAAVAAAATTSTTASATLIVRRSVAQLVHSSSQPATVGKERLQVRRADARAPRKPRNRKLAASVE